MRKLSGLFIAAAVTGVAWWQLPDRAPKTLSAQSVRSSSGETSVSKSKTSTDGYDSAARSLMKQAQDDARKGDIAGAKRKALQASRFPVKWAPNELTPTQLIARLDSGNAAARPSGLNPSAVSGRPSSRDAEVVAATGTNSRPVIEQTGFEDEAPASRSGFEPRTPKVGPSTTSNRSGLRPRVDDYMQQAEAARRQGDVAEATRLAKVAELLAVNVKFEPGESTPTQFLAMLKNGGATNDIAKRPAPLPFDEDADARPVPAPRDIRSAAAAKQQLEAVVHENPFESAAVDSNQRATASQAAKKKQAVNLMAAAREDLKSGNLESAYQKATIASQTEVTWSLLEERPQLLMAEIERRQRLASDAGETFAELQTPATKPAAGKPAAATSVAAKSPASQASFLSNDSAEPNFDDAPPARQPIAQASNQRPIGSSDRGKKLIEFDEAAAEPKVSSGKISDQQYAKQLLTESRQHLREGLYDEARSLALKAQALGLTYGLFDERPELVLRDIDRVSGSVTLARNSETPTASGRAMKTPGALTAGQSEVEQRRAQAQKLLANAKQAAAGGQLDQARQLVQQADSLEATFGLFDDRPEVVMADIERLESRASQALPASTQTDDNPFGDRPTRQPVATNQKPTSKPGNASFLPDDEPQFADSPAPKATPAPKTGANPKQNSLRAASLLAEARMFLKKGQLDAAKAKADEAEKLNVTYELFSDRPQDVLAEVARLEGVRQVAASEDKTGIENAFAPIEPKAGPTTVVADRTRNTEFLPVPQPDEQPAPRASKETYSQARKLMTQARADLKAGQLDAARAKAEAVREMELTFSPLDDRPEAILAAINQATPATAEDLPAPRASKQTYDQARKLLAQARTDVKAGRIEDAREKAESVRNMELTFSPLDDRPEAILALIGEAVAQSQDIASNAPGYIEPGRLNSSDDARSLPTVGAFSGDSQTTAVHPSGLSAQDLYRQGESFLRQGNKTAAYQAFLTAWQSGQKLDAHKSQRLQDYLRDLAPKKKNGVQLAAAQSEEGSSTGSPETGSFEAARPIDIAEQRDQIKFDRLRSEVLNSILRADTLREKRPDEAIDVLDKAMADVENAGFDAQRVTPLVSQIRKTRGSIQGLMAQKAPILDLERRNKEVKEAIKRDQLAEVNKRKDLGQIVEDFNVAYKARDYAKAEILGKQAYELDPEEPTAVEMYWKSKFAYRNAMNEALKNAKEEGFWKGLNDVEWALAKDLPTDANPAVFGKGWAELSKRRKANYKVDERRKSEDEKRIEESLGKKISLQFDNAPLLEVVRYIRSAADINIAVDQSGLDEEGVTTNTPITIDITNIPLKSALKLVLDPLHLGYSIESDVLNVTSRVRQQGKLVAAAYSVADLVVAMRGQTSKPSNPFSTELFNANTQTATPSMGGLANRGQFQVASNQAGLGFSMGSGMEASTLSGPGNTHDFNTLIDLITSVVEPDSWSEIGGHGTIRQNDMTLSLVIRQTQQVHQEIADLLEQLRRLQDLQITVEVRLVNVSDKFFERIGIDFDFDFQDSLGGPLTDGISTGAGGGGGQGQQGGQQGQAGGGGGPGNPLPPFGSIIGSGGQQGGQQGQQGGQQGQQGGQQGQAGAVTANTFTPGPLRQFTDRDRYARGGTILGLVDQNSNFTQDSDIAFRQGSFDLGVPDFGSFQPSAGIQVGLAILSDIETFFFIQAAQGDERSNIMFAPKVTLFNGDSGTVTDSVQRPFVLSLTPTVGAFSVGFTPQIQLLQDGVTLTVRAVASADRRFVRMLMTPSFTNVIEIQTFSTSGGAGGGGGGQQGQQGGQQGQQGGQQGQQGGQGGFGGGGQQQGFGGIGGGAMAPMATNSGIGRFGRGLSGSELSSANPMMGFGGIGGGQGGQQGGQGGQGGQQGQQGGQQGQQGQQGGGGGGITLQQPIVATVSVSTVVSVPDGGTVLLGGIKRLREGRSMTGVPILNKIPYLSRLFKNSGIGRETESVMLMVTPRIIIFEEEEQLLGIELE